MFPCLALVSLASVAATIAHALGIGTFARPAKDHYPETWFHLIGGNVMREGLTADLEAVQAAGISGIQFFHGQFGGPWPGVTNQIPCLSAEWDKLVRFTADECDRLGLTFKMQNCPGWSMSGGPWIAPSNAMRVLDFKRADVIADGSADVRASLPVSANDRMAGRDWRDIAVLAFPTPADDTETPLVPASVSDPRFRDAFAGKAAKFDPCGPANAHNTMIVFETPVTVRTMQLPSPSDLNHHFCYEPGMRVRLEAVAPYGTSRIVAEEEMPQGCWQDDVPHSIACDESLAAAYRLTLVNTHAVNLRFARLFGGARLDNWEGKAAWVLRGIAHRVSGQSSAAWIAKGAVRDVTDRLNADGDLTWRAPAGKWTILRVGHVNNGARNGPAPQEGTGWECDKLDPRGFDANFEGYLGRLVKGTLAGGKLQGMLVDSWECKRQTWTPRMEDFFQRSNGYGARLLLPAVFGWVIESPAATERFLLDWRRTVGRLVEDNYYGRMAELGRKNGLHVQFETAFGDVLPGDLMRFWKYADTPMCEFWQPHRDNGFVGSHNFKPVRPCVSAARLYGKKRVAAEAFTSFELTWNETFRLLKGVADKHFARGVSHIVFHTYTHNPRVDWKQPGTSFGNGIGTPFLRGQTWWRHMPEFTMYLARCGTMLEAGRPVNDVLWYLGDELGHKPDENAPFPDGFAYDYCNRDALFTRIDVQGGALVTPEGVAWRALWIPGQTFLLPETEKRLDALSAQGATIMRGDIGAGLRRFGWTHDFTSDAQLLWNHRQDGDADWYFVANPAATGVTARVTCRIRGAVEAWDPVTGAARALRVMTETGAFTLDLAACGSVFVVIRKGAAQASPAVRSVVSGALTPAGPWHVSFPEGWGAPARVTLDRLASWKEILAAPEAKAFSGTARYETTVVVPGAVTGYELDLGRVEAWAKVWVNGKPVRSLWCEPYRCDVSGALKPGVNTLVVEVTSTWRNRLIYDAGLPEAEQKTWTIRGPDKGAALGASGLLGPVRLIRKE